ncbi:MAG: hypothetical protein HYW33_03445 [Candidatus Blackburnbacteria bacterium]|nr:hypothetical protein [Candidatus Blackburnbacteria bacterium]
MNKNINAKTIILIVSTVVLALVAVGTALWLYQLQSQPVAPNVPESQPKATAPSQANCTSSVNFTLAAAGTDSPATPTSTPTPTPTRAIGGPVSPTATLTPTPKPTATSTPAATPTSAASSTSTSGSQATATPTSATSSETLPNVGVSWPVVAGISAGALVLFIGILLAL